MTDSDPIVGRMAEEVAIVTGSTSGLGRSIALRFAEEGARVVVTGRNAERGERVVASCADAPGEVVFVAADLSLEDECARLVDTCVERFGSLTVLVNNAVATQVEPRDAKVEFLATETWEQVHRVGITAVMWMCRAAIPAMRSAGRGSIINVSSRAAERATPNMPAYAATKGGMNALTRAIYDANRERGFSMLTTTIIRGMQVLRICAINPRVEDAQLRRSLEILAEIGQALCAQGGVPRLERSS